MSGLADRIRLLIRRPFKRLSGRGTPLLAVAAIASGLILGFVSLIPDIEAAGTRNLGGTVPRFSEQNESFVSEASLSEVDFVNGSCAIFVTALDEAQLQEFNATGNRPEPQLDCDHRVVTFEVPLQWIIIENRGGSNESYEITARFLIVRSPRAPLAILGLPLVLGGAVYLILRTLRRNIEQMQEQIRREREKR